MKGEWFAVIMNGKKRKTLYVAELLSRFLVDEAGPVDKLEMRCLMPKVGSGNILNDTPELHPEDIGMFDLKDVIAGPLSVSKVSKRSRKYSVAEYDQVVKLFNDVKDTDLTNI